MEFNFEKMKPVERYRLMIQSIVPRPIAWTLTQNPSGNFNLAPFSYFNAVHSDPPLIMMSIGNKSDKSKKDTRANIEREKIFVVHIASSEHASLVTASSAPLPQGESEVEKCGLSLVPFSRFSLPRIEGVKIALACKLDRVIEIGTNNQGLIFGEILQMHVDDSIVSESDGRTNIDAEKLKPLGRLGGNDYGTLGEVVTIARPEYVPG